MMAIMKRIAAAAMCAMILFGAAYLVGKVGSNLDENGPERLEQAVRQAAVACYSTEGRYPASVDYLIQRYGLRPDPRYAIHYTIFASNLPPEIDITVKYPD